MGSVVLIVIPIVILFALGILASPFFFIPAGVVIIVALIAGPVLGMFNRTASTGGGGPSGVPTTEEASYEPVREPPAS
jgi:hypothetical protein